MRGYPFSVFDIICAPLHPSCHVCPDSMAFFSDPPVLFHRAAGLRIRHESWRFLANRLERGARRVCRHGWPCRGRSRGFFGGRTDRCRHFRSVTRQETRRNYTTKMNTCLCSGRPDPLGVLQSVWRQAHILCHQVANNGTMAVCTGPSKHCRIRQSVQPCRGRFL